MFKNLFIETNPIPVKYALSLKGLCRESYRLPMCKMQDSNKEKLKKILKDLNILWTHGGLNENRAMKNAWIGLNTQGVEKFGIRTIEPEAFLQHIGALP